MTCIFCKKNGQKRSILREIRAQTFYYPLYGVATAYSTNEMPSNPTSGGYIGDNSSQNFQVFGSPDSLFIVLLQLLKPILSVLCKNSNVDNLLSTE